MPLASTGRALGSVFRCFTTVFALKVSNTADHGSNFRKKSSVRVVQANNKFLLICFDYLVSSFFIIILCLPRELSAGFVVIKTAQI